MKHKKLLTRPHFIVLATVCICTTVVHSGEPTAPISPTAKAISPWQFSADAGLSLTTGNSDTLTFGLRGLASYFDEKNELYLGADYFYGDANSSTTADNLRIYETYNRLLTDRFYFGGNSEYLRDEIADIDYRVTLLPKLGYYIAKNDAFKLSVEAGVGYQWQQLGGIADDFSVLYLGERSEYQLTSRTKLFQSIGYIPEASDFSNYRIQADAGVTTRLSNHWALNVFARDTYDAIPATGSSKNDLLLMTSISYAFGGLTDAPAPTRRTLWIDSPTPGAPKMGWDSTAALGASISRGNSKTIAATAAFDSSYRTTGDEYLLHLDGGYGEDQTTTTIQSIYGSAQYHHFLSSKVFAGALMTGQHDDIADVSYRIIPAAVLGAYLVKNDSVSLSFEAGPGWTFERVGGVDDNYFTVAGAERFTWAINDTVSLRQSLSGTLDPANTDKYLIRGDIGIDVALRTNLSLRNSYSVIYDNEPAVGSTKTDTLLSSGIVYRF